MGCISSKYLTKSMSIKLSLQRRSDGICMLEELCTKDNGNDEFLAFISAAKKINSNLLTGRSDLSSNTSTKPALDPSSNGTTVNMWELIARLEEQGEEEKQGMQHITDTVPLLFTRSRSCPWPPEDELPAQVPRNGRYNEDEESKSESKGIVCSRSFHTVEDVDAVLEDIQLVRDQAMRIAVNEHNSPAQEVVQLQTSTLGTYDKFYPADHGNSSDIEKIAQLPPGGTESITLIDRYRSFEDVAHEGNITEKGLKRKAVAKGLTSLQIPPSVEFPVVPSLKGWRNAGGGGQVYSPGASCVTPKFGSYNIKAPSRLRKRCSTEDSIFEPELLAAFEECMQQLEVEEDVILKQIELALAEDCTNNAAEEAESSSSN